MGMREYFLNCRKKYSTVLRTCFKGRHALWAAIILGAAALVAAVVTAAVTADGTNGCESIYVLTRPTGGEAESEYQLKVIYDGAEEEITVWVSRRQKTLEELDALFDKAQAALALQMTGDNQGMDAIRTPLNLVDRISEYDMGVEWYISDTGLIDYWGDIHPSDETAQVEITACLRYLGETEYGKDVTEREYTYSLTVLPISDERTFASDFEDMLAAADQEYRYADEIVLPASLEGREITYLRRKDRQYYLLAVAAVLPVIYILGRKSRKNQRIKRREEALMREYPELVTKLALLIGAGMTPYNALVRIVQDNRTSAAYIELGNVIDRIQSGMSQREAYASFGRIFGVHCYGRLGTLLEQNVVRGNERLRLMLSEEAAQALEERKDRARRAGEQAGTKLLLPMMLLLVVVLVIIMVPAFMSF